MYKFIKYVGDRVLAFIGLCAIAPLLILVALLIVLDSRGGAFFLQERVGKDGVVFRMLKFRTMKSTDVEFDKNAPVISDDNANLTRVGRILRKLKIDELPQLFNVMVGQMSLVGPRPLRTEYLEDYAAWERRKFAVRPGMTGLSQVRGNGHLTTAERSYYDVLYTETYSLLLDTEILLKTVGVICVGEERFLRPVPESELERMSHSAD